jgi:hypothetical protein
MAAGAPCGQWEWRFVLINIDLTPFDVFDYDGSTCPVHYCLFTQRATIKSVFGSRHAPGRQAEAGTKAAATPSGTTNLALPAPRIIRTSTLAPYAHQGNDVTTG